MKQIQNDDIFDILVGKISTAINRTFLRAFANEGIEITTEQWSVLACLWKKDKVTQQALCDLTAKDKPSMTRLIDKLEKRNLVTRVSDHNDRRINLIHLTETGAALQEKATELVQQIAMKTLNDITDEELNTSRTVLKKIMVNLNK
jgi:Transcriptional regulators